MTLPRVRSVDGEHIVYNDNQPKRVQTCHDDTSLFPVKPASPCSQKGLGDAWVSFNLTDVVNLAW